MRRKNIKDIIRNYFFVNPNSKLRVREIEKELEIPLPSVIRYVKELKSEGILKIIKIGNVVFYSADRSSDTYILEKKLFNIKSLYSSGFVEYLRIVLSNPSTVVFGSYAKGEDIESSDIDLYIETASKKEIDVEKFEKLLKRKIQIFRYKSITDVKNIHLANNIINGVNLNGFVEVFK